MNYYRISLKPQKVSSIKTKYRRIRTTIPSPSFVRIFSQLSKHEPSLSLEMLGRLPVCWDRAVDFQVFDQEGNCWIDFTSGIFVANAGHGNAEIIDAIKKQASKPLLHSYIYPTEIRAEFLRELINSTPQFCEKAYLFSSGSEATECALRIVQAYGQTFKKRRSAVISFQGGMHGVTMGAEFLRGVPGALETMGNNGPDVYRLPFPYPWKAAGKFSYDWAKLFENDLAALKKHGLHFENIAGFIIEPFRSYGAIFFPQAYIRALVAFSKKNKSLLAIDEIQGGFGRTGRMFAFEHYGIKPDLICLGKGLSSSLPMSAVVGRKKILELPGIGDNTHSTHSGNPLACAAALANLRYIKKHGLVKESARKGKILFAGLNRIKNKFPEHVAYVSGRGLIAAILFKNHKTGKPDGEFASRVCERAMQKGLLMVHTGIESIKIAPPLTIPDSALQEGIMVLEESIKEIAQKN